MVLTTEEKAKIINEFKKNDKDCGSLEIQIAIMTTRINYLTEHLKEHPKDNLTRMGLIKLVNKRKRLLAYLRKHNIESYKNLIEKLGLRK